MITAALQNEFSSHVLDRNKRIVLIYDLPGKVILVGISQLIFVQERVEGTKVDH